MKSKLTRFSLCLAVIALALQLPASISAAAFATPRTRAPISSPALMLSRASRGDARARARCRYVCDWNFRRCLAGGRHTPQRLQYCRRLRLRCGARCARL